ncbi:MAG: acyltransferase, partial [Acidimicrobiia bacterium]|nr:acyltransferase [Acidimicrobiia bacterium]
MASPTHRLAHLPTLDGLRAVAVIAVLGYHAGLSRAGGGFLGVEVFFVVSGFVITALLHAEVAASGAVDLRRFWVRRIRRLVPALAVLLVAVAGLGLWGWPDEVARWRGEWFASGAWVSNWYLIAAERSYFDTVGRASPLRHLWSLAVEAQFYLLWPPVFAVLARRLRSRRDPARDLALVIGAAAMVAFALGQLLYRPGSDPSRVYYGTDTRAVGLLIGATLAMLRPPGLEPGTGGTAVAATPSSRTLTIAADGVSALGLAALVSAFVAVDEFSDTTYRGGITAVAMLTATLIALSLHPEVRLARAVLGHPWAQAVGRRSYSLYLWHWPVFVVTRPDHDLPLGTTAALVPRLVLTVVLAELSYRWVEQPVRDGRARHHVLEWWRKATSAPGPVRVAAALSGALAVTAAATTATLVVAGVLDASSRGPGFDTTERTIEIGAAGPVAPGGRAVPAPGAATVTPDTTGGAVAGVPAPP